MSAEQLFSQQAGPGGVSLSVGELAAGLQQLGLLDPVEAGRLARAAARMDSGGGHDFRGVNLAGFCRLMGSVPGEGGKGCGAIGDEAVEALASMPTSVESIEETAMHLQRGRWSIRIVCSEKLGSVWSSAKAPGKEGGRPFSVWRPDVRASGGGLHKGLQKLVGGAAVGRREFLLGDIGVRGLDPPTRGGPVLQVKLAGHPPKGHGLGLGLDAWVRRFLPRPIAFRLLWHDRSGNAAASAGVQEGGGAGGLYVWRPVPPSDLFVTLGAICSTDATEPTDVDVRCVPRTWLVRGDSLGPALWSLGDRREIRIQDTLGGVIACPTENLKYLPSWSFISDQFYAGT
eukprot:TRINITY_DN27182_c0_g1_i1.p1 TRINITY_DN27182_c0_g1~~TRINITY_DN27182_c0_g1_i1.p1  ORF type:complete len:367 (-),score=67.45 TRINITY_DN27182_c0_g1_i1:61-1089(-)